ncbi:type II secretion system secretin GspD [Chenggangzhangella methanolivorans]|uniref:Type II secretion system secretin GspD n=1 Tax=Chenggangzhangella methanolivorans TaxID=1437009 RepID=A0A9E6RJT5_9HYPH|nr:type II secretion system secretin GspD [Chenggangzhangella methanolivorans]
MRFAGVVAGGLACLGMLVGCSATTEEAAPRSSLMNTGLFTDLKARQPRSERSGPLAMTVANSATTNIVATDGPAGSEATLKPMAFVGDADEGGAVGQSEAGNGARGGAYRLNFENADVREVVQAVLGETLRINYTMTEDVSGKVTISSPRAMNSQELLSALEASLNANGFSMTKSAGGYRIAPTSVGGGVVDTPFATQPSYGVSVVPLRHVSAATMGKLVAGFITENDGLRVDQARNAMVVRGPGSKRQEAIEAIMSFDADWMQNQAVGIYEVRRAAPDAVVAELNRVFDAEKGASGGVIQFKPIGRLRAVMVVSKNPALLKRAETWVRRLDRDTQSGSENVFVYKARYRDSKELARIVSTLFRAGGDGGRGASASTGQRSAGASSSAFDRNGSESGSSSSSGFGSGSSSFGSGSSSSGSDAARASLQGRAGAGQQSAFNNPNFGEQTEGSQSGQESGGDSIDLTSQSQGDRANVLISADPANNAVVVYADGYTYQKILAALRQLDSAPLQVAIQATIAEVTLNDEMKQGVEYFVKSQNVGLGNNNGSVSLFGSAANALGKLAPGFNILLGTNSSPDVLISALDQVTDVEVLSSPSLVVAENQPANFQVGDEVPVQTQSLATANQVNPNNPSLLSSVEYKDTGVILNVTPRIGSNDAVTMQIEQEISSVRGGSGANTLTPTLSKRRVASNISVTSGQTVLLAGLISKRDERGKNQVPLLGDLPGVGGLFGQRSRLNQRTELVVFIRPTVIRTGEDAQSVAEEFRSRLLVARPPQGATRANYSK